MGTDELTRESTVRNQALRDRETQSGFLRLGRFPLVTCFALTYSVFFHKNTYVKPVVSNDAAYYALPHSRPLLLLLHRHRPLLKGKHFIFGPSVYPIKALVDAASTQAMHACKCPTSNSLEE